MFPPVSDFEAKFVHDQGKLVFYPAPASPGYPVTVEERDQMIERYSKVAGWRGFWPILLALIVVVLIVGLLQTAVPGFQDQHSDAITFGSTMILIGFSLWRYFEPARLVRKRPPVAPKRAGSDKTSAHARDMHWFTVVMLLWMLTNAVGLTVFVAIQGSLIATILALFIAFLWYQMAKIAVQKWKLRKKA